jgi:hypothetical protein
MNIYNILHHLTATGVVFTACGGRLNGALVKWCDRGIHLAQVTCTRKAEIFYYQFTFGFDVKEKCGGIWVFQQKFKIS